MAPPVELEVGQRLLVHSLSGEPLGLGLYLWNEDILLDKGTRINQSHCRYECVPDSPVRPFFVHLHSSARAFCKEGGQLFNQRFTLGRGKVMIEEIKRVIWNHGIYVAGRFEESGGHMFWLLLSELDIPREGTSSPQLVS